MAVGISVERRNSNLRADAESFDERGREINNCLGSFIRQTSIVEKGLD